MRPASVAHDRCVDRSGGARGRRDRGLARRRAHDRGQPDERPAVAARRGRARRRVPADGRRGRHGRHRRALRPLPGAHAEVRRGRPVAGRRRALRRRRRCRPELPRHAGPRARLAGPTGNDGAVRRRVRLGHRPHRRGGRARRRTAGIRRLRDRPEDDRPRLQRALRERPPARRAPDRPARCADRPAPGLRIGRRRAHAADDHAAVDRRRARARGPARAGVQSLDLRREHAHRAWGWRLGSTTRCSSSRGSGRSGAAAGSRWTRSRRPRRRRIAPSSSAGRPS